MTISKQNRTILKRGVKIRIKKTNDNFPPFVEGDIALILGVCEKTLKERILYYRVVLRKNRNNWDFSRGAFNFMISERDFEVIKPVNPHPYASKTLICEVCGKRHKRDLVKKYKGFFICATCWSDFFRKCRDCGREMPLNDANRLSGSDGEFVCNNCVQGNYFRCHNCDNLFSLDDERNNLCEHCRDEYNRQHNILTPDNKKFVNKSTQARDLPIGIEIEAELQDSEDYFTVYDELSESGCGVCEDGSLNSGVEVQIPASNKGTTKVLVKDVCDILNKHCYIASSCGLHVHIGYPADLTALKNAIIMAYVSEPIFYGVNPHSRLGSQYCKPIRREFGLKEILNAKPNAIDKMMYSKRFGRNLRKTTIENYKRDKYNDCRYSGFNLHSFFYRGTLEFRYHSGTTDPTKIMNWANLLKKILVYAKHNYNKKNVLEIEYSKTYEERSSRLFDIIKLPVSLKNYFTKRYQKFNPVDKVKQEKVENVSENVNNEYLINGLQNGIIQGVSYEDLAQNEELLQRQQRERQEELLRDLRRMRNESAQNEPVQDLPF